MSAAARKPSRIRRFFADDGALIRVGFFALLAGTAAVLYVDYGELTALDTAFVASPNRPILPAFDPDGPAAAPGPDVTTDADLLNQPLTVDLVSNGVLQLVGTIDPGAADRVRDEIERRREYIKTVSLNSPGGSVGDALSIGAIINAEKFATEVAAGALCASSCPLVLAGGVERRASPEAAIGVHQIYATASPTALPVGTQAAGEAMSSAQRTTATITRHLRTMGVDPELWLHALETPPDRLYFLSPKELTDYRLITKLEAEEPAAGTT